MICRGEVWSVSLDPTRGAEIQKTRPCVVISSDHVGKLPLRMVVPITAWKAEFEASVWHVKIEPDSDNSLHKPSAADAFQTRSVSTTRFVTKLGVLSAELLSEIVAAVGVVIEIEP